MKVQDIIYLIASHMVIIDNEIDSKELEVLNKKEVDGNVIEQQVKIFSDDEKKISLQELISMAKYFSDSEKERLFIDLFEIAYSDTFYHTKERNIIELIAKELQFSSIRLKQIEKEVREEIVLYEDKKETILEKIYTVAYKLTNSDFFEGKLLEGKQFVDKVKSISSKAVDDLHLASNYMIEINDVLSRNYEDLKKYKDEINAKKRNDETSNQLVDFVNSLEKNIGQIITQKLKENREILDKKQRTINYFTIAFMGRTKAGKSTFHKVVTGEEVDDIGVGKLRTTRFNRVFNWENIRVVDTPGIGAPGGKSDTETAKTIIDEADLICYVVTNDSIQETEFDFLSELKEKNKPLFIILNVKENLENQTRLKRFLENPLKWKEETGNKSIQGHFQRIRESIGKNYDANFVEIIPLQLLAALLTEKKEISNRDKELLYKGSNIAEYSQKVKQTIFRTGHLKKTQNIIEGCNFQVNYVVKEAKQALKDVRKITQSLKDSKSTLIKFISDERKRVSENICVAISNKHNEIKNAIANFANDNCETHEKELGNKWKEYVERGGYYKTLEKEIGTEFSTFEKKLKDKIEECNEDFQMMMNLTLSQGKIETADTTDYRFVVNIVGSGILATLTTLAVLNIWNPAGWVLVAITGVFWGLSRLFTSKDKKIEKAKEKIRKSLEAGIDKNQKEYEENALQAVESNLSQISQKLSDNFDVLIQSSKKIAKILTDIEKECLQKEKMFNVVLFYRILEHLRVIKQDEFNIQKIVELEQKSQIERNFQNGTMSIQSMYKINQKQEEEISKLLQTTVKFKRI